MSRSKRIDEAGAAAGAAFDQARQAAAQVKPLSSSVQAAAGRGLHRARAFAAPQVERAGHVLEDSVAPKVSAMLSSAAQRLDPVEPRRRRWRKLAGISLLTAAASAVAAVVFNRAMRDEKARTSTDADADLDVDGQVSAP
jgi:hypothetical protein